MSDRREDLLLLERDLVEIDTRKKFRKLDFYQPYPKQQEFHDMGIAKRERLLMAGNQNGKTFCGGAEAAFHLTGQYPDWWLGRRWDRPVRAWVAGVTGESTRDNPQRILLGTVAEGIGTGSIPKNCLDRSKMTLARGVSDLFDTVLVKHISGGMSELKFKSYERGREKWQGDTLDFIWFDEEPPLDVYTEGLARISATNGLVYITFTPLQGMSEVVLRYLQEKSEDRGVVSMTIDDAEHIPAEQRKKIIDGYPAHEREARARGIPMLGSGRIFTATEESITVDAFPIPRHWRLIWGVDFGMDHPFAAVLMAVDVDTQTKYFIHAIRMKDAMPIQHAQAMKTTLEGFGARIPVAWPQDGHQREEFDGKLTPLAKIYKAHGLRMLDHHATHPDGKSNSTEIGILGMQEDFGVSKIKVFRHLTQWFDEYRLYHRKDGDIVKLQDDLMSASRIAWMMRRKAQSVLWEPGTANGGGGVKIAKDAEIDPWERG